MSTVSPFEVLQEYDQRCRANAKGLPIGEIVKKDWVGIGFSLNGKQLVSTMSDITEILPPPQTIRVPGVQAWVKGIANVRGTLIPILDMQAYLTGHALVYSKDSRALIINKNNIMAGLLVEEVYGMRRFKPELKSDSALPDMGTLSPYLEGVFTDSQFEWSIFDVEKLVNHEKFLKVI